MNRFGPNGPCEGVGKTCCYFVVLPGSQFQRANSLFIETCKHNLLVNKRLRVERLTIVEHGLFFKLGDSLKLF